MLKRLKFAISCSLMFLFIAWGQLSLAGTFGYFDVKINSSATCQSINKHVESLLDEGAKSDPDIEIGYHLYIGSKAKWEVLATGIKVFNEGPPPQN